MQTFAQLSCLEIFLRAVWVSKQRSQLSPSIAMELSNTKLMPLMFNNAADFESKASSKRCCLCAVILDLISHKHYTHKDMHNIYIYKIYLFCPSTYPSILIISFSLLFKEGNLVLKIL